jgi:hypothetical protein
MISLSATWMKKALILVIPYRTRAGVSDPYCRHGFNFLSDSCGVRLF